MEGLEVSYDGESGASAPLLRRQANPGIAQIAEMVQVFVESGSQS